jgi:predicted transcriptional regulator
MRIEFQLGSSKDYSIDLFDLETKLAPTAFLLEGRNAVLVPIRAVFADDLLGTSEQHQLFPQKGVAVLHERTYFCSPRNVKLFERGAIVVFYESGRSGGRKAAIALARIRSAEVVTKSRVGEGLIESGVLDEADLSEITSGEEVTALSFDNVIRFKRPVPLERLRRLGCIDKANAVTSRAITPAQLHQIVHDGMEIHD